MVRYKQIENIFITFRGKGGSNPKVIQSFLCRFSINAMLFHIEMFYLNTIEQLLLLVEQLDQLKVCLPYSRLLAGIPILAVFQNLRWNSNKTSLLWMCLMSLNFLTQCSWQYSLNTFSKCSLLSAILASIWDDDGFDRINLEFPFISVTLFFLISITF